MGSNHLIISYLWRLQSALLHFNAAQILRAIVLFHDTGLLCRSTNSPACFQLYLTSYIWSIVIQSTKPRTIKKAADSLLLHADHVLFIWEKKDTVSVHICKHLIINPNFDLGPRPDCSSAVTKWNQTCWLLCGSVKLKVYWYKCVMNVLHSFRLIQREPSQTGWTPNGTNFLQLELKEKLWVISCSDRLRSLCFYFNCRFQTDVCRNNLTTLIWFSHFSNRSSHKVLLNAV